MARIMFREIAVLAHNAFGDVLTPPAGKKYEILNVAFAQYLGLATVFRMAENAGGGAYLYLDETSVTTTELVKNRSYQSILIPHPNSLAIAEISTGTSFCTAMITYMAVDT